MAKQSKQVVSLRSVAIALVVLTGVYALGKLNADRRSFSQNLAGWMVGMVPTGLYSITGVDDQFDEEALVAVSPAALNVIYVGVPNPLEVAVSGVPSDAVDVLVNDESGSIEQVDGLYSITVTQAGTVPVVVRYRINGVQYEVNKVFRAVELPALKVTWGDIEVHRDCLPKDRGAMADQDRLNANYGPDFHFSEIPNEPEITSAQYIYQPRTGDARAHLVQGNTIPERIREVIRNAEQGDRIIVDRIRAKDWKGDEVRLPPFIVDLR